MFHLVKAVKTSSVINRELTKVLPIALSNQQHSRSYSDHKIPERLQHIPTAQNPKFFDMVSFAEFSLYIDFFWFRYYPGRIFFPPRMSNCRGLAGWEHEGENHTCWKEGKSKRNPISDATLWSHIGDQFPIETWQRSLWDYHWLSCTAFYSQNAN